MPKKVDVSFSEIQTYIERYYRKTGILLSYGKAVVRMDEQKKKKSE